jgi:hypothetical protein
MGIALVEKSLAAAALLLASSSSWSKVTSHALTARGSDDSGLVLIEKYLEGAMFEF